MSTSVRPTSLQNAADVTARLGSGTFSVGQISLSVWLLLVTTFALHYTPKRGFESIELRFKTMPAPAQGVTLAAVGIALGTFRIVTGTPLHYYIIAGYVVVVIQTVFAPRVIIALAYDSGGVTTSTVTVPLVAALGLGLASTVPGRTPLLDGFGLIAFTCLFPIMTVMGYAQVGEWWVRRGKAKRRKARPGV